MKKFEELTLDELKALYERVAKEKKEKDSFNTRRAESGVRYYFVNDVGAISFKTDIKNDADNFRYETGNYLKTLKEVEEYRKKLIMQQQYRDWCKFDVDWKCDGQAKWYCAISKDNIYCDWQKLTKTQGVIYAESKERIKEFIDKVGEDDFKKYILEVE